MQRLGPGNAFRFRFALCPCVQVPCQSACFLFCTLDGFLLTRTSGGELPLRLLFFVFCFHVLDRFLCGENLNLCFRASLCQLSLDGDIGAVQDVDLAVHLLGGVVPHHQATKRRQGEWGLEQLL